MSNNIFEFSQSRKHPEVILVEYSFGQQSIHDSNIVELYPTSFAEESEKFHTEVTKKYKYLHNLEASRRASFLEECKYIGYQIIEKNDHDAVAERISESAWERKYEFPDGSILGEFEITFIDEYTTDTSGDLQSDIEYTQEEIEEYQRDLRKKYEIERAKYRLELESIADLGAITEEQAVDLVVETAVSEIDAVSASELKKIFEEHDMYDPIRRAELERIKHEEKKEKLKEILNFLSQGLEEE